MQETARLEAQAYELEQKTALAAEAKAVLDSWVRYEGQVKQRQQKELADNVMAKVRKELESPKILQQILQQSIADVESKRALPPLLRPDLPESDSVLTCMCLSRNRLFQGAINMLSRRIRERFPLY